MWPASQESHRIASSASRHRSLLSVNTSRRWLCRPRYAAVVSRRATAVCASRSLSD
jgi:hypothetical protein